MDFIGYAVIGMVIGLVAGRAYEAYETGEAVVWLAHLQCKAQGHLEPRPGAAFCPRCAKRLRS